MSAQTLAPPPPPIEDPENIEPGASHESMLITTDSFEEFSKEMSVAVDELVATKPTTAPSASNISIIEAATSTTAVTDNEDAASSTSTNASSIVPSFSDDSLLTTTTTTGQPQQPYADDCLHDKQWLAQTDHVFVLSTAGKPIYSLHGNEDKLATIFGVMQALVSVVQANHDTIMSIHAAGIKIVFLVKSPLILVAASKNRLSVQQIQMQLT